MTTVFIRNSSLNSLEFGSRVGVVPPLSQVTKVMTVDELEDITPQLLRYAKKGLITWYNSFENVTGVYEFPPISEVGRPPIQQLATNDSRSYVAFNIGTNNPDYDAAGTIGDINLLLLRPSFGAIEVGGLQGGFPGRKIYIHSDRHFFGSEVSTLIHEDTNSSPQNRFVLPNNVDYAIPTVGAVLALYDGISERWRLVSGS